MAVQARLIFAESICVECTIPHLAPLSMFIFVSCEMKRTPCHFGNTVVYSVLLALRSRSMDQRNGVSAVDRDFYIWTGKVSVCVTHTFIVLGLPLGPVRMTSSPYCWGKESSHEKYWKLVESTPTEMPYDFENRARKGPGNFAMSANPT